MVVVRPKCVLPSSHFNFVSTSDPLTRGLRAYRDRNFLTQADLAALLEVSTRSVQEYEAEHAKPRPSVRRRISELYGHEGPTTAAV